MRPVACALSAQGLKPSLIFTDQHALRPDEYGLGGYPHLLLGCREEVDPHVHVEAVTRALLPTLRLLPDLLMVQGDTSSALGGALAGFTAGVPVAHVEAGLRTHDTLLPRPEEEYRTAIDADANLLFAPTELAAANLLAEKVPGEIFVTGNTSIDAVLEAESLLPPRPVKRSGLPNILITCHRRESWRDGLQSVAAAAIELARAAHVEVVLPPNSFVAADMNSLLGGVAGVTLTPPCSHGELLQRIRCCDLILSDSGGIQEEAPTLGVPLLVLRDKTERPEGIVAGSAILVGTDATKIAAEAKRILNDDVLRSSMTERRFPFGDGRAGERIATIVAEWLKRRSLTRRLA